MESPKVYEAFGECKSCFEWSLDHRCKVSWRTLRQRLRLGWDVERALTKPPRRFIDRRTKNSVRYETARGTSAMELAKRYGISRNSVYAIRGKQP